MPESTSNILPPESDVQSSVQMAEDAMTFESIKLAIYAQMKALYEHGIRARVLNLSADIYEILNNRLVFKTAAHKERAHLITPYGNLLVANETTIVQAPRTFQIE